MTLTRSVLAVVFAAGAAVASAQSQPITIRAAAAFDGAGRTIANPTITVQNGTILRVKGGTIYKNVPGSR